MLSKCAAGAGGIERVFCKNGGRCEHDPKVNETDEFFNSLIDLYKLQEYGGFPFAKDDLDYVVWGMLADLRIEIKNYQTKSQK